MRWEVIVSFTRNKEYTCNCARLNCNSDSESSHIHRKDGASSEASAEKKHRWRRGLRLPGNRCLIEGSPRARGGGTRWRNKMEEQDGGTRE